VPRADQLAYHNTHQQNKSDKIGIILHMSTMGDSRDISRDMQRLASLYNGVVLEQLQGMRWDRLVRFRMTAEGKLRFEVKPCRRPVDQVSLFEPGVRESVKRTAVSVNKCITAIDHNTAWLAFCIEGIHPERSSTFPVFLLLCLDLDFTIQEIKFFDPKPIHKVELWYIGEDESTFTDYAHTVLKFIPMNGEEAIVADATYAQYSFDNGIDTYSSYCASKTYYNHAGGIREDLFGRSFEDRDAYEGHYWEESYGEAAARTTNNVMVKELDAVGGIKALLNMDAEAFRRSRDIIFVAMKREMGVLRRRIEDIFYGNSKLILIQLADGVEDCYGPGHRACMQSWQRRSEMTD
jgi:hypothetical protein